MGQMRVSHTQCVRLDRPVCTCEESGYKIKNVVGLQNEATNDGDPGTFYHVRNVAVAQSNRMEWNTWKYRGYKLYYIIQSLQPAYH